MTDTPINRLDVAVVLLVFALVAGVLWALVFRNIPDKNMSMFSAIGLSIWSVVTTYVGFRWGSSISSRAKDATIAAQLPKGDGQ